MKTVVVLVFVLFGGAAFLIPQQVLSDTVRTKPSGRITLQSHKVTAKKNNYGKTIVNFRRHSPDVVNNPLDYDLRYGGGFNHNGDTDWFIVATDRTRWSRITDLGEMDWSDEIEIPALPSLPCGTKERCGRIQIPGSKTGKKLLDEDVNPHMAKPQAGHMYLVHRFRDRRSSDPQVGFDSLFDYYVLVRVEELKPQESCTITWKTLSLPKKYTAAPPPGLRS